DEDLRRSDRRKPRSAKTHLCKGTKNLPPTARNPSSARAQTAGWDGREVRPYKGQRPAAAESKNVSSRTRALCGVRDLLFPLSSQVSRGALLARTLRVAFAHEQRHHRKNELPTLAPLVSRALRG